MRDGANAGGDGSGREAGDCGRELDAELKMPLDLLLSVEECLPGVMGLAASPTSTLRGSLPVDLFKPSCSAQYL